MTIASVQSLAFSGIDAVPVEVQVQISSGLPAFLVVGLPDKAVGEARERMRAALTAMGLALPPKRVLINLAPADLLSYRSSKTGIGGRSTRPLSCLQWPLTGR
jgi:magnesium chelatase family protein